MHNNAEFFELMYPIVKEFLSTKKFATKYKMKTFDCFQLQSVKKRNSIIVIRIKTIIDHIIYVKDKLWAVLYGSVCVIRLDNSFIVVDRNDIDLTPSLREFVEGINALSDS